MAASLLRQLTDEDITCPAGERLGDSACFCSVEQGVVEGRHNPESIESFCAGDYQACPSWQVEKESIAAGVTVKRSLDVRRKDAERKKARLAATREVRVERAKELLFGDSEVARKFRARTGITKRTAGDGMAEIERRGL